MPPAERFVPCFAAEPAQEGLPYGRWAERLQTALIAAFEEMDADHDAIGSPGEISWYPDRSWHGRTYIPATSRTTNGYEVFGYVRFVAPTDDGEPTDLTALADYTDQTAEHNPDWKLDICDEVIGSWRGHGGASAAMTLVWGRALVPGGVIATAELADLAVDQCELSEQRFTIIAPDDYGGDLLDIKLYDRKGKLLASESLYEDEEEDGDEGEQGDDESVREDEGAS